MPQTQFIDGSYRTFQEEVAAALDGKEHFVLELAASGNVQLFTGGGASPAIGTMFGKLKLGATDVSVRMLGKEGTVKVIQNAAIATGARVMAQNGGKVITATSTNRSVGIKLTPGAGAAGDVIEVLDVVEYVP